MKIYISKNYKDVPLGIVIAKNREIAQAFFIGTGEIPYTLEEIDIEEINTNLVVLITSYEDKNGIRKYKRGI